MGFTIGVCLRCNVNHVSDCLILIWHNSSGVLSLDPQMFYFDCSYGEKSPIRRRTHTHYCWSRHLVKTGMHFGFACVGRGLGLWRAAKARPRSKRKRPGSPRQPRRFGMFWRQGAPIRPRHPCFHLRPPTQWGSNSSDYPLFHWT